MRDGVSGRGAEPDAQDRRGGTGAMDQVFDALPPGSRIGGYDLVHLIGVGGFGMTYAAFNPVTERWAAIKEFFPAGLARRGPAQQMVYEEHGAETIRWALAKFRATTAELCRLSHDHIVRVHDYVPANDTGYMIMELLEGQTLADRLHARKERPLTPDELRPVIEPVLDAIAYLHERGLIHRDIAADNIVITAEDRPVLIDFGALSQDFSRATGRAGTVGLAKAHYTAPDQKVQNARPDPTTDIYAVGALLYLALTGAHPADATERITGRVTGGSDPYRALAADPPPLVPPAMAAAIDRCLSFDKGDRPQSIAEVKTLLGWDDQSWEIAAEVLRLPAPEPAEAAKPPPAPAAPRPAPEAVQPIPEPLQPLAARPSPISPAAAPPSPPPPAGPAAPPPATPAPRPPPAIPVQPGLPPPGAPVAPPHAGAKTSIDRTFVVAAGVLGFIMVALALVAFGLVPGL